MTANRVRSSLSTFFSWCVQRDRAPVNPVIGTEKNAETSRERVLAPAELRLIWNALPDDQYGDIVRLLALTAQRETEIGDLSKTEITDELIVLPAERTKNKRAHVIPLSGRGRSHHQPTARTRWPRASVRQWGRRLFRLVELQGAAGRGDHQGERRQADSALDAA